MNKNLIIFGVAVLLICVGLSGCNENTGITENQDDNKSEENDNGETDNYITLEDGTIITGDLDKIEFIEYQSSFSDGDTGTIEDDKLFVTGKLKNIANYMLDEVKLIVRYFDFQNYYLGSREEITYYLPPNEIWRFSFYLDYNYIVYQDETSTGYTIIERLSFEILAS